MNVRVEFELAPIRHIAVQCPHCNKWFCGWDVVNARNPFNELRDSVDIKFATFTCPVCDKEFGGIQHREQVVIQEVGSAEECYKGCLKKKEVWE